MATPAEVGARFERQGGVFVQAPDAIAARLRQVRALVFDWDGVFNTGEKAQGESSGFSEADSMGVNMLRYAFWCRDAQLPFVAIITGEQNASAEEFARRERLHALYQRVKDKRLAMADFRERYRLKPDEVACLFDDINDIAMAADCGLRILVRRNASVLLRDYLVGARGCDYVTACESGHFAVREAAELMLGLTGRFEQVLASRCANDEAYRAYLEMRQAVPLDTPTATLVP
jgi:3-deoxy-D-manno-octulosonate 8-phosphate phosphatase (KDO 8-P phosphatase)